ncbi:hypothetical protein BS50DRAFT_677755 [Corynespora cassiicola Philippines]|uniref:Fucose-specific lectin n=1 Tax=Corynespora cassiicola Philippines TaxID=1448308 RepID=A0A2T2NHH8_CORCC|nr:hypothetical protein BS50DRAFT_677755 [Corynespora cassiicola Philippines]
MSQPSFIPRDVSAATGDSFDIYAWDLHSDGRLWRKELGGEWLEYPNRRFLFAPVAVKTSATTQTAFSVDAFTGWIVWQHFENNQWDHDNWHMLEMDCYVKFTTRPTVVSRSEGRIDVFDVDTVGNVWTVSYDGSFWSEWKMIGFRFGGELAVTSWGEDRIDVIGLGETQDYFMHISWTPETDWPADWQGITLSIPSNYNGGFSGPIAVSWLTPEGDGIIDVFTNAGSSYHLTFRSGQWAEKWEILPASHEGGEFPNTQSLVAANLSGGNPYAHVISRGTDDCIHHNTLEDTDAGIQWGSWDYIWCLAPDAKSSSERLYPTGQLTTFAVMNKEDVVNFLVKDLEGNVLLLRTQGRLDIEPQPSRNEWHSLWENIGHGD